MALDKPLIRDRESERTAQRKMAVTKRGKHDRNKHWSNEVKYAAVEMFLKTGNMKEVEHQLNIPYITLKYWKKSAWWDEYTRAIKGEEDLKIATKVSELLEKALRKIGDRIEEGDFQYDPQSGELVRVPVKAQVLNAITANLGKQRLELNNQPTEHQMHDKDATNAKLQELASAFAAFVGNKAKPMVVKDIVDAEYEQLPPGE
ncbi:MAG: hypothetical protein VKL39_22090 [Leptolyngbyaceae bacterium]|nr:hypothetical protein [Leptolyngbyaceae bacterium]